MKIKIEYFEIQSDHILAVPEFFKSELVEADSLEDQKLVDYITSKTDGYKNHFVKENIMGFNYTSRTGAVKVSEYVEPTVKKL